MNRKPLLPGLILPLILFLGATPGTAQTIRGWSRVSVFAITQNATYADGTSRRFNEILANIQMRSASADQGGLEYAFNARGSTTPGVETQSTRTTIYDAWVSGRTPGGMFTVRAGQMWLDDLGGIGAVGGVMAEYRAPLTSAGRFRLGVFSGAEPQNFQAGFVHGVKKGGAWAALDGDGNRRHVVGYVLIKDSGVTERSVITTTNFIPAGKQFFIYQAAEYDLRGPGGIGKGGLNYLFANMRYSPVRVVELMATYHRGRSIDTRTITQDILDGRPVDQKSLDGYRFQSTGGRITVEVMRNVRVYAGYANDRNNGFDKAAGRVTAGLWASNVARTGFDLTVSDNRVDQPSGKYNAWYGSLGHSIGPRFYGSVDYSTSLSLVRLVDSGGVIVETRPKTKRYGTNGVWNLSRWFSLLISAEQLKDDSSTEDRVMLGTTFRF